MYDITEILHTLLDEHHRAADACDAFEQQLEADKQLQADYKEWCEGNGYNEKKAYKDYINELIDSRDVIWDDYSDEI